MQPGKDLKFELVHRFNEGDEQGPRVLHATVPTYKE